MTIDIHIILWYNIDTKEETRYIKMTTLDKAIQVFGFENPITITIAVLEEQGETKLAEQLYEECAKEYFEDDFEDDCDHEDNEPDADEVGFDPYEGCYTYDC